MQKKKIKFDNDSQINYNRKCAKNRITVLMIYLLVIIIVTVCAGCGNKSDDKNTENNTTTKAKHEEETKALNFEQWYLDDSEGFAECVNSFAWGMDSPEGKADIDISFSVGMKDFSIKRNVNIAVIDSKEEHGEHVINLLNDNDTENEYESICSLEGINTFLVDIDYNNMDDDEVINSIEKANQMGASICVMPFTTSIYSERVMNSMKNADMLFVCAAGNDGILISEEFETYPAMYGLSNVLIVGDERCDGKISDLSNYSNAYVDILAPGTDILCLDKNGFSYESGTSYACAIAAGVCALVKAGSEKEYDSRELKNHICNLCLLDDDIKEKVKYGRINAIGDFLRNK